ncbi:MAG: S41 family peptidase [Desulfobacterales bacterium]
MIPPNAFAQENAGALALPRFPSVSPDGSEIVFSAGGDLWLAPVDGRGAKRITSHPRDDLHSSWSPDGKSIVFTSMRDGYMNLWRIGRDGTGLAQLTFSDRFTRNPGWAIDKKGRELITFSGLLEADVYKDERPYRISPEGGEHERIHGAFGSDPRISPDGSRIAFTRGGYYHDWHRRGYKGPDAMNVWIYETKTGSFHAVTNRDRDDGRARWIDDDSLVFMSERGENRVNLYRANLDGSQSSISRLTDFEAHDVEHFDVSRDGNTAVIQVWDRLYTLDPQDRSAKPKPLRLRTASSKSGSHVLKDIDSEITEAALSPDGLVMAYIAYGRVYIRHMDRHSPTRAVTPNTHARHKNLAWSPDGLELYFTGDSDGTSSIYKAEVALTKKEIRQGYMDALTEQKTAERKRKKSEKLDRAAELLEYSAAHKTTPGLSEEESPDSGGIGSDPVQSDPKDPFAPVEPRDPVSPQEPEPYQQPPADPYSGTGSDPSTDLTPEQPEKPTAKCDPARWRDAVQFHVTPVVAEAFNDRDISLSPAGGAMAFRRGRGDLVVMDLDTKETKTLVEGWDAGIHWRWSPDGRHIAYAQNDMNFSSNIYIVPADGSKAPVNITRHPRNDLNPRWSADSRILTFISDRSGETYGLYRIYLDPALENLSLREINNYYEEQKAEAKKRLPLPVPAKEASPPVSETAEENQAASMELENAWRRVKQVTPPGANHTCNEMTPGGDRYVFNAGRQGLIAVNWDGSQRKRIGHAADVQHLDVMGTRVVYISNGRAAVADLDGDETRYPAISDSILIDRRKQSLQKFRETARVIEEGFYRPDMKGIDWPALVADYQELIEKTQTPSEFSDVTNRMIGELKASHTGISNPGPGSDLRQPSGRLGIDCEPTELADGTRGYRVNKVIPLGPADREPMRLQKGDVITGIDMRGFDKTDTLLKRLRGKTGREVIVEFLRPIDGESIPYRALIRPVSYNEFARLRYDAFREESRRKVSEISDGRLGYIHIQAMNQASLEEFQARLYASAEGKEGLIIDVRNNAGGSTTDRILTSIMATEHAYTIPAGADSDKTGHYPQDRLDAPRYTLPVNMLANQKSFSNSEILAHAFSTLDRGTLVGEQTYGGVISTGSHALIDGATVRVPFRGWYLPDGTEMEHNGAVPNLEIAQTPEDEIAGRDRQLEAAAEDLMERIEMPLDRKQ